MILYVYPCFVSNWGVYETVHTTLALKAVVPDVDPQLLKLIDVPP